MRTTIAFLAFFLFRLANSEAEQWAAPVQTEQWAPEVRTEIREPAVIQNPVQSPKETAETSTDGKKLVWVNWGGQAYQAFILKSEGRRHYVTYKGWPSNYNEWISSDSVITEAQATRMLSKQKKQKTASDHSLQDEAYKNMDQSRELSNRLNQETQQQYRDTERYYEDRRYR